MRNKHETRPPPTSKGSLTIVGTGIALGQLTAQTLGVIREADLVFTVVGDPATMAHLVSLSRAVEDLTSCYAPGRLRTETYFEMADRVMARVRQGLQVCFALYGHPGVLSYPAHLALRAAWAEGYPAEMLPGISAEASLLADLDIDPGDHGLQSYEAGTFLGGKIWDPTSALVLWQVAAIGDEEFFDAYPNRRLGELIDKLTAAYGEAHEAIVYEAATSPMQSPRADRIALRELGNVRLTTASTLFVPPVRNTNV